MKILLSSFGSSGDFNPFLALGRALKHAGHDVFFLANPYYEKNISNAGLNFIPAGEYVDLFDFLQQAPRFLDKHKGPKALFEELVIPGMKVMYPAASEAVKAEKIDLVVSHLLEMGGLFAALQAELPYCILMTTPTGWMSVEQPSHYSYYQPPVWLHRLLAKCIQPIFVQSLRLKFAKACREISVPNCYGSWNFLFSKAMLNLGAWSSVFRPSASDDPPNSHVCGYFRDDHVIDWHEMPPEIARFFSQEQKPVIVGMGSTAAMHGHRVYDNIIPACKQLKRPLLLVGPKLEKYNDKDNSILTVPFAPFGSIFPKAHVVVHHGGINTTGETLRAGVPGIVVPFGYDQFDNAFRVEMMNAGKKLRLNRLDPSIFKQALLEIDSNETIKGQLTEISNALRAEKDGALTAVQLINTRMQV